MKKLLLVMLFTLVLAACGTKETSDDVNNVPGNNSDNVTQGSSEVKEEKITLYKSDENAENTVPFDENYDSGEEELVPFIYSKVNEHDVELLDYTMENEDKSLLLNLGDDIYTIQGSAGANMFVETLARSYFENLPELQDITFLYKGSDEPVLDHMNIGLPYKRQDFDM
ncbi:MULTISPECIES: fructose-2,6-bisphosphatase [Solibacillus]|uniref:fructose-2,6-bisphosphatase n=1 Tax=Solibacillus TaxID=648800 RepID=UPI00203EEE5F|nr:fructose-2,6-bisphosphatase [Solibacillus isronensis]MCM3723734.1 fructose-2,6-bisphosphatase [Solibacillus isronensis]